MKAFITVLLSATGFSAYTQILKEPDLVYTNNYFNAEAFKSLKDKPEDLKYQAAPQSLTLTHQSKGIDVYPCDNLFPRSDYNHSIRDFNLSFDFSFTEASTENSFIGLAFFIVPNQDIEYKDSVGFLYFTISSGGKLYYRHINSPFSDYVCYTCPNTLKDKNIKKAFNNEDRAWEAIPGFKPAAKNNVKLERIDKRWTLYINAGKVLELNKVPIGEIDSKQAPIYVLGGKSTLQLENLQENYGYQNESMLSYLKDLRSSGTADLTGSCIKGTTNVLYEITTNRGNPSVKITWNPDPSYNITHTAFFDFKEGVDYGVYKHRGLSSKSLVMFGEGGEARNIKMKPDKGEISFDFYFNNGVSSRKSGNYTYYTSQYCPITIRKWK